MERRRRKLEKEKEPEAYERTDSGITGAKTTGLGGAEAGYGFPYRTSTVRVQFDFAVHTSKKGYLMKRLKHLADTFTAAAVCGL